MGLVCILVYIYLRDIYLLLYKYILVYHTTVVYIIFKFRHAGSSPDWLGPRIVGKLSGGMVTQWWDGLGA